MHVSAKTLGPARKNAKILFLLRRSLSGILCKAAIAHLIEERQAMAEQFALSYRPKRRLQSEC